MLISCLFHNKVKKVKKRTNERQLKQKKKIKTKEFLLFLLSLSNLLSSRFILLKKQFGERRESWAKRERCVRGWDGATTFLNETTTNRFLPLISVSPAPPSVCAT